MKTRNLTRLGALALTMTMVTTSLMGGTLAKYTTTVSGEDTVTMARFGYTANDGDDNIAFTTGTAVDIDLFDDLATDATGTIAFDSDEEDTDTYNMMFAPGAYGTFQIELDGSLSDVDIEMLGSTVVASATGSASTSDDFFISYTITYEVKESSDATVPTDDAYDEYDVHRVTMDQFAYDLQTVLSSIVLQKNTVGTISVAYEWCDMSGVTDNTIDKEAFDFHGATDKDPVDYNTADTQLGDQWANDGSAIAPTFTLLVTNVASQIVDTAKNYTSSVTADAKADWDSGAEYAEYNCSASNYNVEAVTSASDATVNATTQYVTFNLNGVADTAIDKAEIDANKKVTAPSEPSNAAYVFMGWALDSGEAVGGTMINFGSDTFNESTTVYAIWDPIMITYDDNDKGVVQDIQGMPSGEIQVYENGYATLPELTSSNYNFVGWGLSVGTTNTVTYTRKYIDDDTLYAIWEAKETNG